MENARSFMTLAAVFLLFIGACTYAADVARSINEGTRLAYDLNMNKDRKIKTELGISVEERYSGAQIVCMIRDMEEKGASIEVNGTLYAAGSDYAAIDPGSINLKLDYRVSYERDAHGNLNKIVFRS